MTGGDRHGVHRGHHGHSYRRGHRIGQRPKLLLAFGVPLYAVSLLGLLAAAASAAFAAIWGGIMCAVLLSLTQIQSATPRVRYSLTVTCVCTALITVLAIL